jgi:hypothetical protein
MPVQLDRERQLAKARRIRRHQLALHLESDDNNIWVLEPQLSGHLNVTRYFRLGIDLGYRFVAAPTVVDGRGFGGINGGLHMQFGWF